MDRVLMGVWDITFKQLLRLRPGDLMGLVPGVPPAGRLRLAEHEFPPAAAPKTLDACVELEADEGGTLYHVEFEASPRSDTGLRVFEHFALAHCGHGGRPVRPVVFYLSPGSEGRAPVTEHRVVADGRPVCLFEFETVRLWELDADELLARAAPALWPIVALTRGAELHHVRRARDQVVRRVLDRRMRRELLGVLYVTSGMRFDPDQVRALIPREVLMHSSTAEELLREGEARGAVRGKAEGKAEGKADALLAIFAGRGLSVGPAQQRRVRTCADLRTLDRWIAAALTATSVAAALDGRPPPRPRRGRTPHGGRRARR